MGENRCPTRRPFQVRYGSFVSEESCVTPLCIAVISARAARIRGAASFLTMCGVGNLAHHRARVRRGKEVVREVVFVPDHVHNLPLHRGDSGGVVVDSFCSSVGMVGRLMNGMAS